VDVTAQDRRARIAAKAEALRLAVLRQRGATTEDERLAAYEGSDLESPLSDYLALVRNGAYRITDSHVSTLKELGLTDDAIFELTVAAALGTAQQRLDAGLKLLRSGSDA
jgi:alkylhydroperoxidase family enzyme